MINIDQQDSSREMIHEGSENSYGDFRQSSSDSRTVTLDNESDRDCSQEKPPVRQLKTRVNPSSNTQLQRKSSLQGAQPDTFMSSETLKILMRQQSAPYNSEMAQEGQNCQDQDRVQLFKITSITGGKAAKSYKKSAYKYRNCATDEMNGANEDEYCAIGQTPRRKYVKKKLTGFSDELDNKLLALVREYGDSSWNRLSKILGKSEIKCHKRFLELTNRNHMVSASWSKEEDELLTKLVTSNGAKDWTKVAQALPGRIGKQCRERWHHHLNPYVVKKKWTLDEDLLIVKLFLKYNSRWSEMARHIDGRTDNQIKNRYNSNLKRRLQDKEFNALLMQDIENEKNQEEAEQKQRERDQSVDSVTFEDKSKQTRQFTMAPTYDRTGLTHRSKNEDSQTSPQTKNAMEEMTAALLNRSSEHERRNIESSGAETDTMPIASTCRSRRVSKLNFKRGVTNFGPMSSSTANQDHQQENTEFNSDERRGSPRSDEAPEMLLKLRETKSSSISWATPQPKPTTQRGRPNFTAIEDCLPFPSSKIRLASYWTRTTKSRNDVGENFYAQAKAVGMSKDQAEAHTESMMPTPMVYAAPEKRAKISRKVLSPVSANVPQPECVKKTRDPCFDQLNSICTEGASSGAENPESYKKVLAIQRKNSNFAYCIPVWSPAI